MRSDKSQMLSGMNTRQKLTAGALVLIVIVVIWQIVGLFGGGSSTSAPVAPVASNAAGAPSPQSATPQVAELVKVQPPTSQREIELMKLQEETQAKYLSALNELQMLKVTRDIAEANQAITAAQLATVTAQKNIVNILAPQQPVMPSDYARGLVNPVSGNIVTSAPATRQTTTTVTQTAQQEANYTVISVSQLQYRWNAVLGYQGNLYNVSVGDVLPADGSVVKSIDKTGVVLEREGVRKKISLVPII